jgi:glucose-6-phosphate 1-dehydrogenase
MELKQDGLLEAYERLLLDAMAGDQTLFADARTVERLWEVAEPLLQDPPEPEPYAVGSWGPQAASEMTMWSLR